MAVIGQGGGDIVPSQEPEKAAKAKPKDHVTPSLVKKSLETPASTGTPISSAKLAAREGTAEATDALYPKIMHHAERANVSKEEVDQHIQYIASNLPSWRAQDKNVTIQLGNHTIEYIHETDTVVSQFGGVVVGEGAFATVHEAIVSASSSLDVGSSVVRKVAKGESANLEREGKITRLFNDSENVRRCHVVNTSGILLEGMKETLEEALSQPVPAIQVARELMNGVCEIHNKGYAHNDLTLKNCFRSHTGSWKVGDLGSAVGLGRGNDRPVNLSIASPAALGGQAFTARTESSQAEDVFAMGLIFYLLENGRPCEFMQTDVASRLITKIEEKAKLLEQIRKLPTKEQEEIFMQPDSKHELAAQYRSLIAEIRGLYQEHMLNHKEFVEGYQPTTVFGQLVKKMLDPNGTQRISAQDVLKELNTAGIELNDMKGKAQAPEQGGSHYLELAPASNYADVAPAPTPAAASHYQEVPPAEAAKSNVPYSSLVADTLAPDTAALLKADVEELKLLMKRGVDVVGWRDYEGRSLLHRAIWGAYYGAQKGELIEFLLAHGADVNALDFAGKPPIYYAAIYRDVALGRLFVAHGADLDVADKLGRPLLVYDEDTETIAYLQGDKYESSDIRFLDDSKLLMGSSKQKIDENYAAWYQNQAVMLEFLRATPGVSNEAKEKLALLSLYAYNKAASHGQFSKEQNFQMTPFFQGDFNYYRSTGSGMIRKAEECFGRDSKLKGYDNLCLVQSPLVVEAIERYAPKDAKTFKVTDEADIQQVIQELQADPRRDEKNQVRIDFTGFVEKNGGGEAAVHKVQELWSAYAKKNPALRLDQEYVIPFCLFKHAGEDLLYIVGSHLDFYLKLGETMRHTGFVLSPDELVSAWVKVAAPEMVLSNLLSSIPVAALATPGTKFPTVFPSIGALFKTNAFKQLENMAKDPTAAPYQRVLAEGTVKALGGLATHNLEALFKKHGLDGLLQLTYFKMQQGIADAQFKKEDPVSFLNAIDQIHQQIQTVLAIRSIEGGYPDNAFGDRVAERLQEGDNPVVPKDFARPLVQLKPSAMHAISSTLSAVEALKGTDELNVCVLKDTYYESTGLLETAPSYTVSTLQGDTGTFASPPQKPIDLFMCEFHHNISLTRQEYTPEDVVGQILTMHHKNMLAQPCTVLIDTTIDLEKSDQMRALLNNPEIQKLVQEGKLNLVFVRSGQKFDMLGMDNYYGGILTTLNNGKDFAAFNARVTNKEDQQGGLSYQGMTHLQLHAADALESYRRGIMENCSKLYHMLPPGIIYQPGSTNPVQISRIEDDRIVFLDIKTPGYNELGLAVNRAFMEYAEKEKLLLSRRASFGFANTNITSIKDGDSLKTRINPGLESEKDIARMAQFFVKVQAAIEKALPSTQGLSPDEAEKILSAAIAASI